MPHCAAAPHPPPAGVVRSTQPALQHALHPNGVSLLSIFITERIEPDKAVSWNSHCPAQLLSSVDAAERRFWEMNGILFACLQGHLQLF